jgi:hypothetical protein
MKYLLPNSKVVHLGFVTGDYLVGCLAQVFVEVETVDGMTPHIDSFGPKDIRSLVFIKHCSCGFHQRPILPLNNVILLRCVWCGEFMFDSFFIKKLFNIGVLEFRIIVTSYILYFQLILILSYSNEFLDNSLSFTFILQKEYPSETRKIINNDKTVFVTANANIENGSKQIHV